MKSFKENEIVDYCINHSSVPSDVCTELEIYTKEKVSMSQMLIGKLEASTLGMMIKMLKAKRVLEFGTFTGYSALAMAEALPDDGEVITLDINPETVDIAKNFWSKSEAGRKITPLLGNAAELMNSIEGHFDFVFIDADKPGYESYLNFSLDRLNSGGAIVCDNMLWSGKVCNPEENDTDTNALRELNKNLKQRDDLYTTLLPIRDGMHVIMKS